MRETLLEKKKSSFMDRAFDLTEIINGEGYMAPCHFSNHQVILARLYNLFYQFISRSKIGEIFLSPLDVLLEEGVNRFQPDLIFIKKENLHIVKEWIRGVPDLVVEVVSQNSLTLDSVIKKEIYERYGVKEFWLVFQEEKVIQVYINDNGRYRLFSYAEQKGSVRSQILDGLEINIEEIFGNSY